MSDNWLQYVPRNYMFRPTLEAARLAKELLSLLLPEAEEIESTFEDGIKFFDAGANWSGVICPVCGEDAESWWVDAMENASKLRFTSMQCTALCCKSHVLLNELQYVWPAAFGSYVLEAMNPNSNGLSQTELDKIQKVLGCSMYQIQLHI